MSLSAPAPRKQTAQTAWAPLAADSSLQMDATDPANVTQSSQPYIPSVLNSSGTGMGSSKSSRPSSAAAVASSAYQELEDKYLKVRDENTALKRKLAEQEDRIKSLHAKFMKLSADLRRKEADGAGSTGPSAFVRRDHDMENLVEDLRRQVGELSKRNAALELKTQAMSSSGRSSSTKRPSSARPSSSAGVSGSLRHGQPATGSHPDGTSAAAMAVEEKENLTQLVDMLRRQLAQADATVTELKAENKALSSNPNRTAEQWNLIQLQKELRERTTQHTLLQNKYDHLEATLAAFKENHARLLQQLEDTNRSLKEERTRGIRMDSELVSVRHEAERGREWKTLCESMQAEKRLLEEENRRMLESAFSEEALQSASRDRRQRERQMQDEISTLETKLRTSEEMSVGLRAQMDALQTKYNALVTESRAAVAEGRQRNEQIERLQRQLEESQKEMALFTDETGIDRKALGEALALVRSGGLKGLNAQRQLQVQQDEELVEEINRLQAALQVLQKESARKLEESASADAALKSKLAEEMQRRQQMEEVCAAYVSRIEHLEILHRSVAGGAASLLRGAGALDEQGLLMAIPPPLKEGQNLIEITVQSGAFSLPSPGYGAELVGGMSADPQQQSTGISTFVSFDFFDHACAATAVGHGTHPQYRYTARYVVNQQQQSSSSSSFVEYVNGASLRFVVNRVGGGGQQHRSPSPAQQFSPWAAGEVSLKDALVRLSSAPIPGNPVASSVYVPVYLLAPGQAGGTTKVGMLECVFHAAKAIPETGSTRTTATPRRGLPTSIASAAEQEVTMTHRVVVEIAAAANSSGGLGYDFAYDFYIFPPFDSQQRPAERSRQEYLVDEQGFATYLSTVGSLAVYAFPSSLGTAASGKAADAGQQEQEEEEEAAEGEPECIKVPLAGLLLHRRDDGSSSSSSLVKKEEVLRRGAVTVTVSVLPLVSDEQQQQQQQQQQAAEMFVPVMVEQPSVLSSAQDEDQTAPEMEDDSTVDSLMHSLAPQMVRSRDILVHVSRLELNDPTCWTNALASAASGAGQIVLQVVLASSPEKILSSGEANKGLVVQGKQASVAADPNFVCCFDATFLKSYLGQKLLVNVLLQSGGGSGKGEMDRTRLSKMGEVEVDLQELVESRKEDLLEDAVAILHPSTGLSVGRMIVSVVAVEALCSRR